MVNRPFKGNWYNYTVGGSDDPDILKYIFQNCTISVYS